MKSDKVRQLFFEFFENKQHKIVPSAPMVIKNDPTLMFTNAGMNQFKDFFLGNKKPPTLRIADTQKCLRVSGKHNDLEEVGHDTYHHTMFEMLGNWSFGDYFKEEAIAWGWELLTEVYKIDKDNLYVTVFDGDAASDLEKDHESKEIWKKYIDENRIIKGSKKDNFWEMGESGPCGPCSEIHVDLRSEEEKKRIPGAEMVNKDHPQVVELWNLVFIQFNRKADGSLENLPKKHVDTGMGFERLCMVMQNKKSNYDTDVFMDIIHKIESFTGKIYGKVEEIDIAMRVIADHLRAIAFAIGDGQIPSNVKAGYVIRRILRRAIRYAYTFLDVQEPFIYQLVPVLEYKMADVFPEIKSQKDIITKVINEEEQSFLRTLSMGIKKFEHYLSANKDSIEVKGDFAFELFDTFGFPIDLTQLIAKEKGFVVDIKGFNEGMEKQKERSRNDAKKETDDWVELKHNSICTAFIGYDHLAAFVEIVKYRKVVEKKTSFFHLVFNQTPFYAESGGQVGDTGYIEKDGMRTEIIDTQKENELIIHITTELPHDIEGVFEAVVDAKNRKQTTNNHSATHLMHAALRQVLGNHVEQKGSLVDSQRLRFDFTHFSKMTSEEILRVEQIVNKKIRENIPIDEKRDVPMKNAIEMGAVALFGEKYGDQVRVISFDPDFSVELCGGTHVAATGQIGMFKIVSEGAIAAGIRRVEAITGLQTEQFMYEQEDLINELKGIFKNKKDLVGGVKTLLSENAELGKQIKALKMEKALGLKSELLKESEDINGIQFIGKELDLDLETMKDLAFSLQKESDNLFVIFGTKQDDKPNILISISQEIVKSRSLHAGNIIREVAREIKGGGGGQPHFATAGGKDTSGIEKAIEKARGFVN